MAAWLGLVLALAVIPYSIAVFNSLVTKRNQVGNAWSQIDVQLKRRHDLVPNLVNAVKGYMAHEKTVLEETVRARQQAMQAGNDVAARALSENLLTAALRSLFAVSEAYPDLKASKNMLALQEELSSTENRIAFARQHYADTVQNYNTARESFPAMVIAQPLGFAKAPQFAIEVASERALLLKSER
jgi:LemA protein